MNKKIIIIHGWGGNPNEPMLKWLRESLIEKGYSVSAPEMPNAERPEIAPWIKAIKSSVDKDDETIFIGHSVGTQAVLRYIETLPEEIKVPGIVLIAPWLELSEQTMKEDGEEAIEIAKPWVETPIDFKKIKTHVKKTIAIFSDNDLYVPLRNKDVFEKELNAKIIIEHNQGHFDPDSHVDRLPSALNAVLEIVLDK